MLTKSRFCIVLCLGLMSLTGVAHAQVYKSYDEEGNVVFSDKPTQDSKEVKINKPNLSDSFEIPPPPPPPPVEPSVQAESEARPEPATAKQPIVVDGYIDTNNDGRISRREREDQRKARRKKKREEAKAAEEN